MIARRSLCVGIALSLTFMSADLVSAQVPRPILPPPDLLRGVPVHFLYNGVTLGKLNASAKADSTTNKTPLQKAVDAYLKATGRQSVAWVNFTNEVATAKPSAKGSTSELFPATPCENVFGYKAVPFITLITPSPDVILQGSDAAGWHLRDEWQEILTQWGDGAGKYIAGGKLYPRALILCWGPGANDGSPCCNAGPVKYKAAYQEVQTAIIAAIEKTGASLSQNVTWVFQLAVPDGVSKTDSPLRFEDYYPRSAAAAAGAQAAAAAAAKAAADAKNAQVQAEAVQKAAKEAKDDADKAVADAGKKVTPELQDKATKANTVFEFTKKRAEELAANAHQLQAEADRANAAIIGMRIPPIVDWIGVTVFAAPTANASAGASDGTGSGAADSTGTDGGSSADSAGSSKKPALVPLIAQLGPYYQRILEMDPTKPIIVAGFGCPDTLDRDSVCWAQDALRALAAGPLLPPQLRQFNTIIGFSWYNGTAALSNCAGAPKAGTNAVSLQLENNSIVAGVFPKYLDLPFIYSWPVFGYQAIKPIPQLVVSSVFKNGDAIGAECAKDDANPPLSWSEPPPGTKSFAVIVDDHDAAGFVHWLVFNLPVDVRSVPASAVKYLEEKKAVQGKNTNGKNGYAGLTPPPKDPPHHYYFRVYALDFPALKLDANATRQDLDREMRGHILAEGRLVGTYSR